MCEMCEICEQNEIQPSYRCAAAVTTKWDKLFACFILTERERNNKKQSRFIRHFGQAKKQICFQRLYGQREKRKEQRQRHKPKSNVHLVNLLICFVAWHFYHASFILVLIPWLMPKKCAYLCLATNNNKKWIGCSIQQQNVTWKKQ